MNIKETQEYYKQFRADALCSCAYCRNYVRQIRQAYPALAEYLRGMGVDIEKPFETLPLVPDQEGYLEYIGAQYIVFGENKGFEKKMIDLVHVDLTDWHPSTRIEEPHFVIEIQPIRLKWVM